MRRSKFFASEKGAAMVELAFAIPVLLLVVWAVIDFARLFLVATNISSAVREGARYAAMQPADQAGIKAVVKRAFQPLGGPKLQDGNIAVSTDYQTSDSITVTVSGYAWTSLTPLQRAVSLNRHATFRWERATP